MYDKSTSNSQDEIVAMIDQGTTPYSFGEGFQKVAPIVKAWPPIQPIIVYTGPVFMDLRSYAEW